MFEYRQSCCSLLPRSITMLTIMFEFSLLLVLTKLADVISTLRRLRHTSAEANPFAQKMMYRLGPRTVIWLIFALTMIIIGVETTIAYLGGTFFQVVFIFAGIVISVIQFAVAMVNWTWKENGITGVVRKVYADLMRVVR